MSMYINRHDRKISHVYKTENAEFYKPACDAELGIWKSRYGGASLTKEPLYPVCKRCQKMTVCHWRRFDEDWNAWQGTCCERAFTFVDGTPVENGFRYCPYCGKALILAV